MAATVTDFDARPGGRRRATWLIAMFTLASVVVGMGDAAPAAGQANGASCGLDVALVVDSSGSIDDAELGLMKDAFGGFVDAFLPQTPTQMAVVEFDRVGRVLQDFTSDSGALKDALGLLESDRRTNWQDALLVARGLFPNRAVPDLIVFASDGRPNKVNGSKVFDRAAGLAAAVVEADAAKAAGARIIAIGIGDKLRVDNLEAIASSSADVHTTDFEGLAQTLAELAIDPCLRPPRSCGADVALVVDSSGSIDDTELALMQDAFTGFVDAFLPATPTQMAVVEFDRVGRVLQDFTNDATALKDALGLLESDRRTNWQDALLVARGLFPHRAAAPDLIVFASDGRPNKVNGSKVFDRAAGLAAAVIEADAAKAAGARIIAIGIGDRLQVNPLAAIASASEDVRTTDFEGLAQTLAQLAIDLCGGTITVTKLVDADGTLTTTDDQTPAEGWEFWSEVPSGSADPERAATDENGMVVFTITPDIAAAAGDGTLVNLFEVAQPGYALLGASCSEATDNGTSNELDAVTGIIVGPDDHVQCTFINAQETITSVGD
jgi:Mg-chelatase subunit ChlD